MPSLGFGWWVAQDRGGPTFPETDLWWSPRKVSKNEWDLKMILCWLKWRIFLGDHVSFRGGACKLNKSQTFNGCYGCYCESLGVQILCVFFNNFSRLDPKAARDRGFNQLVNIHHSRYIFQCTHICICLYTMCLFKKKTYQRIHLKHYVSPHFCPSSPLKHTHMNLP